MVKLVAVAMLLLVAEVCNAATTYEISQHGITWTFSAPVEYGQFVNGDYWVLDPGSGVEITNINPGHTLRVGGSYPNTAMNGSMINPSTFQGYDGAEAISYSAASNVAIGVSPSTPLVITGDKSLVSTISNEIVGVNNVSWVNTAAVLTVVSSVPPSGTFRPGISSTTKTFHNKSSVNTSLLSKLAIPSGNNQLTNGALGITVASLTQYANYFQMVFLDHWSSTSSVRYLHPTASGMDNYSFTENFSDAALLLNLNFSDAEKDALLTNFIQIGIDLYSYIEAGGHDEYNQIGWPPDGGNSSGRKLPILFAGIMLNYNPMKNIGQKSGDYLYSNGHGAGNPPSDYVFFGEDAQTFYVAQSDVDYTARPVRTYTQGGCDLAIHWCPDDRNGTPYPYTSTMIGMPEWGIRYATAPQLSDSAWTASYRSARTGGKAWIGTALVARIMGAKTLWGHDAFFDYVDRFAAISKGLPDPFGHTVQGVSVDIPNWFIVDMWDTYRRLYPYPPYGRLFRNVRVSEAEP